MITAHKGAVSDGASNYNTTLPLLYDIFNSHTENKVRNEGGWGSEVQAVRNKIKRGPVPHNASEKDAFLDTLTCHIRERRTKKQNLQRQCD
jgi:hypothetical protein